MTMAETPDQSSTLDQRAENGPPRRTDIDGLRILVCGGVILSHALLIFATEPRYHLKSPEPSLTASIFYEFTRITTMPAFFVIAGWSALVALRRRGSGPFVKVRAERLLSFLSSSPAISDASVRLRGRIFGSWRICF